MTPAFERPSLDRRARVDTRNSEYQIRPIVAGTGLRMTMWKTSDRIPLGQRKGNSVGFGWASMMEQVDSAIFPAADHSIELIGQGSHEDDLTYLNSGLGKQMLIGSSLLGGARYLKRRGWITGYHWCTSLQDVMETLCGYGPVLLGVTWYESMYDPLGSGILEVNGPQVGGHCLLATGYIPGENALKMNLGHTDLIEVVPSLGRGYGVGGRGYMRTMDLAFLLTNGGEAVVPDNMRATEILTGWQQFMSRPIVRTLTSPFRRD